MTTKWSSNKSQLSPDERIMATLSDRLEKMTELLKDSCDERGKLQAQLAQLQAQLQAESATAKRCISEWEKAFDGIKSDLHAAGNIIAELEEALRDKDAALSAAKDRIAGQEFDLKFAEENIAGQDTALKFAEQRMEEQKLDLQSAADTIEGQQLALARIMCALHQTRDECNEKRLLQNHLRQKMEENADLQSENDDLQNRITALEQAQKAKDSDSTDSFGPEQLEEERRLLYLEAETANARLALAGDNAKILEEECHDLRKQRDATRKEVCRMVTAGITKLKDAVKKVKKEGSSPGDKTSPEEALLVLANKMVDLLMKYPDKLPFFEEYYSSGLHTVPEIEEWIESLFKF